MFFTLVNLCGFITLWLFDAQSLLSIATSFLFSIAVPVHCSCLQMLFFLFVCFVPFAFGLILWIFRALMSFSVYVCNYLKPPPPPHSLSLPISVLNVLWWYQQQLQHRKQTVSCAMHVEHYSIHWLYGNCLDCHATSFTFENIQAIVSVELWPNKTGK